MRKELKILHLILAVALLSAGNVYADITLGSESKKATGSLSNHPIRVAGQAVQTSGTSPLAAIDGLEPDFQSPFNLDFRGNTTVSDAQGTDVKELPAGPDSAMLYLCALGSIGVFHVGRSAKKLNFTLVPDWYHSGSLRQIGHVHALDLDFDLVALPLANFFDQTWAEPRVFYPALRAAPPRLKSQFSLSTEAPRGPPLFS